MWGAPGGAGCGALPGPPPDSGCGDRAQQAVGLVVRAGCEEQGVGRAIVRGSVAELQGPEAVDRQRLPARVPQLSTVLEPSVRHFLVGVDLAVAEVSYEQIAAEATEVRGCEREPPRCVELAVLRDTREQRARGVVGVHEPSSLSMDLVSGLGVLF